MDSNPTKLRVDVEFPECMRLNGLNIRRRIGPQFFFNYNNSDRSVLFAFLDAEFNFLHIDEGTNEKVNDATNSK